MKTTSEKIRRIATVTSVFRLSRGFRLWLIPLLIAALPLAGWWIRRELGESIRHQTEAKLQAFLESDVNGLRLWLEAQKSFVSVVAQSRTIGRLVGELEQARIDRDGDSQLLIGAAQQSTLRELLEPRIAPYGYLGYIVIDRTGFVIAASRDESVGAKLGDEALQYISPVMVGQPLVAHPFLPALPLPDRELGLRIGLPTMVVAGPIRDTDSRVTAALVLIIRPEDEFTRILNVGRMGQSDETYAFDADGLMISHSRFDDQLRELGLLPDDPDVPSQLNIQIRNPGGDLTRGFKPSVAREEQPLTRMASSAVAGQSGVDVEGYRDYRGVMVVGAWTWLKEYEFGVATEMDLAEALAMPAKTRQILWMVVGLLVLGGAFVVGTGAFIQRLGKKADQAIAEARTLGQYTLEEKLGEGGMGAVYRARHAMLRRPTAVKLLHPDRAGSTQIARFEREVQMTSRLTHPNTIAVYDYGKTPDGVFYYAMEYLPGVNLAGLVEIDGPQSEGRVIHILRQVCGSLEEAHAYGLIHRDIKPENIILCVRGGIHDMAKVLDFGIVKDVGGDSAKLTMDGTLSGTPHYVPPEALRVPVTVDARADIYAVGAVGYFLLTGMPVFDGESIVEICTKHLKETPVPPSERAGRRIAEDLERLILSCLTKDPAGRPSSAFDLAQRLSACADAGSWGAQQARDWWRQHPDLRVADDEGTPVEVQLAEHEHTATIVANTDT